MSKSSNFDVVASRAKRLLRQWVRPYINIKIADFSIELWEPEGEPRPVLEALKAPYKAGVLGLSWGRPWQTTWFRMSVDVGCGEIDSVLTTPTEAIFDLGFQTNEFFAFSSEAMVYDFRGDPVKGLNPLSPHVTVTPAHLQRGNLTYYLEATVNPQVLHSSIPTEEGDRWTASGNALSSLVHAELTEFRPQLFQLANDLEMLVEIAAQLPEESPRRWQISSGLSNALTDLDFSSVPSGNTELRQALKEILQSGTSSSAYTVNVVGHAHVDLAWLWPRREGVRKAVRTWANVIELAHNYPDLVFVAPQAVQYDDVESVNPALFSRIRLAVKAGNWVPVGPFWVESDLNLPGGEAVARNMIFGTRYFSEKFGVRVAGIWLIDTFGFNASLPQLARLAGLRWFMTQKLNWAQANKLPHDTFWWEGLDGSRMIAHIPPARTRGELRPHELQEYSDKASSKGKRDRSLLPFGYSDGGGGPTRGMMERLRRLSNVDGSPNVEMVHPDQFFDLLSAECDETQVWRGELYLERHRGTYTSQSKIKRRNREVEFLLRAVEWISSVAFIRLRRPYDHDFIESCWKDLLINQFHDILPGSATAWVNREARDSLKDLSSSLLSRFHEILEELQLKADCREVANPCPFDRTEVITIVSPAPLGNGLQQGLHDGSTAVICEAPSFGFGALSLSDAWPSGWGPVKCNGLCLENGIISVNLSPRGTIVSLVDLSSRREIVPAGAEFNVLHIHNDYPSAWDAWDVDSSDPRFARLVTSVESIEVVDMGPLLASVVVTRRHGASRFTQKVILRAGENKISLVTEVEWRESERLLKLSLPMDVHADDAVAEIQFGHVKRPTHQNTPWEAAKYEQFAHKFLYVGETGYGVAITSNLSYGYDIRRHPNNLGKASETLVRLSLLRAPRSPDPRSDIGYHRFEHKIVVGADLPMAVREGYLANSPMILGSPASQAGGRSLQLLKLAGSQSIVVEAMKLADDQSGDLIFRLYEALGARAIVEARLSIPFQCVLEVDLLEDNCLLSLAEGADGAVSLSFRPFEIKTVRFCL